jgi:hypothetical protein
MYILLFKVSVVRWAKMALWILPVGLACAIGAKAKEPFALGHSKIKCVVGKILKTCIVFCVAKLVCWSVSSYSEIVFRFKGVRKVW